MYAYNSEARFIPLNQRSMISTVIEVINVYGYHKYYSTALLPRTASCALGFEVDWQLSSLLAIMSRYHRLYDDPCSIKSSL